MAEHPKILVGASLPRSGHHFLARLLRGVLGRELQYCEFYTPPGCCKQIPCTKRTGAAVIYQKQHDRQGEVPQDLADALYVVQHRHPLPQALSDRELDLSDAPGRRPRAAQTSPGSYPASRTASAIAAGDVRAGS